MNKLMTILAVLTVSSTVFAGSKDLKVMNTFLEAGAETEFFLSQEHLGLNDIVCSFDLESKEYECKMQDIAANSGNGVELKLTGKKARSVYKLLVQKGAVGDIGSGKGFVSAKTIRCTQSIKEIAEGSEADRTYCSIELE